MKKASIVENNDKEGGNGYSIKGELTIYTVSALCGELLSRIKNSGAGKADFDLSEVSGIDSAGIQLLLSAKRGLKDGKTAVSFSNPCGEVERLLSLYSLTI